MAVSPRQAALDAAARIVGAEDGPVRLGVVLGTGMGGLVERLDQRRAVAAAETGWLPPSTATGHAGRVVCGRLAGATVAMLQGRVHAYEGHGVDLLARGVELLAALGARVLLVTNAAGGLRPDMEAGEVVVLTDHVDLVRRHWDAPLAGAESGLPRPVRRGLYDLALAARALAAMRQAGCPARAGVYAYLAGPSYETRSEYRMLRRIGADVVGMSTVPEIVVAARLGLRVAACSVVTNVARPDAPARTDAEDVCRVAAAAATGIGAVIEDLAAAVARGAA